MKPDTQGTVSGLINLAIVVITVVAVIEIEAKFNFPYSYSYSDWAIAAAMGIGIYVVLSLVYSLIAKLFKLPRQRIMHPLNIFFVFMPWW